MSLCVLVSNWRGVEVMSEEQLRTQLYDSLEHRALIYHAIFEELQGGIGRRSGGGDYFRGPSIVAASNWGGKICPVCTR